MKIRSALLLALSRHAATPRCTNPVPFGGWPSSYAFGSNDHRSPPVSALSASPRLYGVLKKRTPPIMIGVAWKLPGRVPNSASAFSPDDHCHATASLDTFDRLMSASGEYFVPP